MTFPALQKRSPTPRARDRLTRLLPGLHILLLYGITVWIHLQVSLQMEMLHMSHDEMSVLATAAWAAGEDWSGIVSQFGYYGYGKQEFQGEELVDVDEEAGLSDEEDAFPDFFDDEEFIEE